MSTAPSRSEGGPRQDEDELTEEAATERSPLLASEQPSYAQAASHSQQQQTVVCTAAATELKAQTTTTNPLAQPHTKETESDDDEEQEHVPLLTTNQSQVISMPEHQTIAPKVTAVPIKTEPVQKVPVTPSSSNNLVGGCPMICRICLEEDTNEPLESPCGCTGTCRFAHHSCVQQWILAKGNRRCEICGQDYRGDFTVPPPTAPAQSAESLAAGAMPPRHLRSIYITVDGMQHALYHHQDDEDAREQSGRTGAAWCLVKFMIFLSLMFLLHHTMLLSQQAELDAAPTSFPPPPPPYGPADPWGQGPDEEVTPGVIIFWIFTRLLIIGVPLYMVMRATYLARQQADEMAQLQAEVHRSDAAWRIVFPAAPAPANGARQQQLAVIV